MTRAVSVFLFMSDVGDQPQDNPFYDQPGQSEPFFADWKAQQDVVRGDTVVDQAEIFTPVSSPTRRHLLAMASVSAGGFQNQLSFHGQGDFGWAGGLPTHAIDADDYTFVANEDTVQPLTVGKLFVTTTRLTEQKVYLAIPATGATGTFLFVEGEEEADFRVWNP